MTNPDNEKCAAIAKDVIDHIKSYDLIRGVYLAGELPAAEYSGDLQQHMPAVEKACGMCALGACLLSKARLYDDVPFGEIIDGDSEGVGVSVAREQLAVLLGDVFTPQQLAMIESAFEMREMVNEWDAGASQIDFQFIRGAVEFGKKFNGKPAERVRAVMENIINYGGEFVVEPVSISDFTGSLYFSELEPAYMHGSEREYEDADEDEDDSYE